MRTATWTAVLAVLLAACGGGGALGEPVPPPSSDVPTDATPTDCTPTDELPGGDVDDAPEAGDDVAFPWDRDDPAVAENFDASRIVSGGPPPDGIEPIDAPCFESVDDAATWLTEDSPALVVELGDDVRAYPLAIMTQHEIANDVIDGTPVVVTYCPLCNSGLAFERTVDGEVLDFGTSGRLFQSNLVMYDRQTRGLWTQFDGLAVVGEPHVGTELERVPTTVLGFGELAELVPEALVLSRASMPGRDYGRNPYPGYDDTGIGFGLFEGETDDRLEPNTRVVGLGDEDDAVALPLPRLREEAVVEVEVGGRDVVVFWAPGAASALDADTVAEGRDVGQTAAFVAVAGDGTELAFRPGEDPTTFVDEATGSTWDLTGTAVDGPLAGEELEKVALDDTFWFVWFAFRPATTVASR